MNDKLGVADEAWVATALLHREQPDRKDFAMKEIVHRAERIAGPEPLRARVNITSRTTLSPRRNRIPDSTACCSQPLAAGGVSSGPAIRATRTAEAGRFRKETGSRRRIAR